MKRSELEKRHRDAGCVQSHKYGSNHDKWTNPKTGKFDWIPRRHAGEVLIGTALSILKRLSA